MYLIILMGSDFNITYIFFFSPEIICASPHIQNGNYAPESIRYRSGDEITYNCKTGFDRSTQGNTATCTNRGWVPQPGCTSKFHSILTYF